MTANFFPRFWSGLRALFSWNLSTEVDTTKHPAVQRAINQRRVMRGLPLEFKAQDLAVPDLPGPAANLSDSDIQDILQCQVKQVHAAFKAQGPEEDTPPYSGSFWMAAKNPPGDVDSVYNQDGVLVYFFEGTWVNFHTGAPVLVTKWIRKCNYPGHVPKVISAKCPATF